MVFLSRISLLLNFFSQQMRLRGLDMAKHAFAVLNADFLL
jgi:hypothetical protein